MTSKAFVVYLYVAAVSIASAATKYQASDQFRGHFVHSWEGGGFFIPCNSGPGERNDSLGRMFFRYLRADSIRWPRGAHPLSTHEGESTFVVLRVARFVPSARQPVRQRFSADVDSMRAPTPADCPRGAASLSSRVLGQSSVPRFLYVYRDSLKRGVDSAYRAIENDGAQICADRRCPNPYLGLESLIEPHEAWWLNTFATADDTARVARVYATNRALATALSAIAQRKAALIGTPRQGFAVYRRDLSRGSPWSVTGARFIVATVASDRRPLEGTVWMTADSTLYALRTAHTLREAQTLARGGDGRIFAVRPNWSMPAAAWVSADPVFWRAAPVARHHQ